VESRDEAEAALAAAVDDTARNFLRRVLDSVRAAIREGRFDDAQPVVALGVLLGWWADEVSDRVVLGVRDAWRAAFSATARGGALVTAREDAMAFHVAAVRDRLSRDALPEIPEAAFDQVRLSQSSAALGGWGLERQARDVAERLAWEPDKSYWEQQKAYAESMIDAVLDPLGPPGTPARTYAHRSDPEVLHWQAVRASAVDKINEDRGDWQVRAERIARTESTAAWNSGALAALAAEGRTHKRWLASGDQRTREEHRLADGQVVPLSRPFRVGEALMMMPGDPSAPPWLTVNCRCTVVGADEPGAAAITAGAIGLGVISSDRIVAGAIRADTILPGTISAAAITAAALAFDPRQARVPAGNGPLSGRWLDTPDAVLGDLLADLATRRRRADAQDAVAWVEQAREAARAGDDKNLRKYMDSARRVLEFEVRKRPAYQADLDAVNAARAKVDEYLSVDWSLADEEGDVGAGDQETVQVGSDTAVSPEAAEVLDRWVQLGGSFTNVTAADRALLAAEVAARGEAAPELYRGVNLGQEAASRVKVGAALDLGVASTSEDEDAALPYAENGDGTPYLLVVRGGRGLNVQDRAQEAAGYAEKEWVVAGQFCVESLEYGGDAIVATVSPCSGGSPASLTAAAGGDGWKAQLRVPKGNGEASGQWVDTPWSLVADALAAAQDETKWISLEKDAAWQEGVVARVQVARDVLVGLGPEAGPNEPKAKVAHALVADLLAGARSSATDLGVTLPALAQAAKGAVVFAEYDWSLHGQETDIGAGDDGGFGDDGFDEEDYGDLPEPDLVAASVAFGLPVGSKVTFESTLGALETYEKVGEDTWVQVGGSDATYSDTDLAQSWHLVKSIDSPEPAGDEGQKAHASDLKVGDVVSNAPGGPQYTVAEVEYDPDDDMEGYISVTSESLETYTYWPSDPVYVHGNAAAAALPDADSWTKVGPQGGSNPGGVYQAPGGKTYYVKQSKSDTHARNEVLAARLYALAGVKTTDPQLVTHSGGKLGTAAEMLDGQVGGMGGTQAGFAADAWLANWDVVGLSYDNVMKVQGEPVRVDLGGSLLFRAQGEPKGEAFGDSATEWDTLRDASKNPQSASVFDGMSDEALKESAAPLAAISDADIDAAVDGTFGGAEPDTAALLKARLKARRDDVLQRAGVEKPQEVAVEPEGDAPAGMKKVEDLKAGDMVYIEGELTEVEGAPTLIDDGGEPLWSVPVLGGEYYMDVGELVSMGSYDAPGDDPAPAPQPTAPAPPPAKAPAKVAAAEVQPGDVVDLAKSLVMKKAGGKLVPMDGPPVEVAEVKVGKKWVTLKTAAGKDLWVPIDEPLWVEREAAPAVLAVPPTGVQVGDALHLSGPVLKKSAGKLVPASAGKQGKHDDLPVAASVKHGKKWTEVTTTTGQRLWIDQGGGEVTVTRGAPAPSGWEGKPAPKGPGPAPEAPVAGKPPAEAWQPWLNKVRARYDANPNKAKATLEESNKWAQVQAVMNASGKDFALPYLGHLLEKQYLDEALLGEAAALLDKWAEVPPGAQQKYEADLAKWTLLKAQHDADLAAWQAANPSALKGMDGAKKFSSNEEGVKWANKHLPRPTDEDAVDMVKQMKGSSGWLNGKLWNSGGDVPDEVKSQVAALDKAMSPLPEDIYLFRGTDMKEFQGKNGVQTVEDLKAAVGSVFVQHAYQPTGVGVDTAFSGSTVQIVYRAPAGTMGVWARPIKPPPFADEREFMLGRNTRYVIHKVTTNGSGKVFVEAEILPPDAPDPEGVAPQPLTAKVGTYFALAR
jgi:hypothetical protein